MDSGLAAAPCHPPFWPQTTNNSIAGVSEPSVLLQVEAELAATNSQLSEASSKAREAALLLDSSNITSKHRSAAQPVPVS